MNFYERFITPKRIHYVPYWIILGTVFLLLTELMVRLCGETNFLTFYLLIAYGGFTLFGIIFNVTKKSFYTATTNYATIATFPTSDTDKWIELKSNEFFALKTKFSKLVALFVDAGVIAMLVLLGSPFNTRLFFIYFLIAIQPCFIIGSHATYALIALLVFLAKILKYPVKAPFYLSKHPIIMQLFNFYSRTTFMVLILYIWTVLFVWISPYGFVGPLTALLIVIGFYPLAMLLWSILQFHALLKRLKDEHIEIINSQIQMAVKAIKEKSSKDKIEQLSGLMEIQRQVEKSSEWPIAIEGIFTVSATILVPIANIILTALNVFKI